MFSRRNNKEVNISIAKYLGNFIRKSLLLPLEICKMTDFDLLKNYTKNRRGHKINNNNKKNA